MPELNSATIAATALTLIDEHGVSAFTIRAVAERLDVTPMALYHHVPDKAALAALVINAAIAERPMSPASGVWRDDLWEMARWMRESTLAHPALAQLRRTYHIWTPAMLNMTERWQSLWQQSGLAPKEAVLAATTSSMAIIGLVAEAILFREMKLPDKTMLAMLPSAQTVFNTVQDPDAVFELAVRSLIDGLHAQLQGKNKGASVRSSASSSRRATKKKALATTRAGRRRR